MRVLAERRIIRAVAFVPWSVVNFLVLTSSLEVVIFGCVACFVKSRFAFVGAVRGHLGDSDFAGEKEGALWNKKFDVLLGSLIVRGTSAGEVRWVRKRAWSHC